MSLSETFLYAKAHMKPNQFQKFEAKVLKDLYPERGDIPEKHWLTLPAAKTINSQEHTTVQGEINI